MEDKNDVPLGGFMSYLRYLSLLAHSGFLRLGYPMLPVSLDFPFLIAPSVFPNVYFIRMLLVFVVITIVCFLCGIKHHLVQFPMPQSF
jgi:hypothetical protein